MWLFEVLFCAFSLEPSALSLVIKTKQNRTKQASPPSDIPLSITQFTAYCLYPFLNSSDLSLRSFIIFFFFPSRCPGWQPVIVCHCC